MAVKLKWYRFTLLLGNNMFAKAWDLKTMDVNWNLFFPDIKYLTDYNYDIVENEWTQKKYTRVEKILELALLFSKLLNSRF